MSNSPCLFIATDATDVHADHMVTALKERDLRVFRFHPEDYPQRLAISAWPSRDGVDFAIDGEFHHVRKRDITAAWYRRPTPPQPRPVHPEVDSYVRRQCDAAVLSIYRALEGRWLVSPHALRVAEDKMAQLARAAQAGLRTPITCFSNDPGKIREFRRTTAGALVVKPHHVVGAFVEGTYRFPLAAKWEGTASDTALASAPAIFQELVDKTIEVRAVVVGDRVFAAEANPPSDDAGIDIRVLAEEPPYRPHELPGAVAAGLVKLTRSFGIRFASADLVMTPSGEHVFLELNPNGQWLWLEFDAGLPLTDAFIAEFLRTVPA